MTQNTAVKAITFAVGDLVTWDPEEDTWLIEKHGNGPFEVAEVEYIPAGLCSCGQNINDPNHFDDEEACGQTRRESVGHHQWLIIKKDGEVIMTSSEPVTPRQFSGAWFIKVS